MNIAELTREMRANSERWFPYCHNLDTQAVPLTLHYALGLAGEVGEVCNDIKKGLRKGEILGTQLGDELADVFIYLLLLADEAGVDMEEAYRTKRDINEQRWGGTPDDSSWRDA